MSVKVATAQRPSSTDVLVAWLFVLCVATALTLVPTSAYGVALRTVRVSGTALTPTASGSYWGSMSSNGQHIAFQSYATNLAPGDGANSDIFVRDVRSTVTRCASIALHGATPNGSASWPSISADGLRVAFASSSSNLVAGDTNGAWDVFVRSMDTTSVAAVSVSTGGELGNDDSSGPVMSADGLKVAFVSAATNLTTGDEAGMRDIYLRNLAAGTTERLSVGLGGTEPNADCSAPSISADGSKVAFTSLASNLVVGDTNNASDVFVVDVATGAISRASVRGENTQANLGSNAPALSGDGTKVAFESLATNLVSKDTNGVRDVFVRDLVGKSTVRASVSSLGKQGNGESREPSLNRTGSKVVFSSVASNLVSGDTNGCSDIFRRTFSTGKTARLSKTPKGQGNGSSGGPVLSSDGYRVAYHSKASNLVFSDANGRNDVFVAAWGERPYSRVQGDSVYSTAVEASKRQAPYGAPAAVVVSGTDWRAALAASALAGTVKGPLLYTDRDTLPVVTQDEIVRLGARTVYIVGDTTAVSSDVATELAGITGVSVERVGSGDGYAVSRAVAARVVALQGASFKGTVVCVSGSSYSISLSAVPLAAGSGRPVVFVNPKTGSYSLPAGTKRAIICGGSGSVPTSAEKRLRTKLGPSRVTRVSASDKYLSAAAIAKKTVSYKHTWDGLTLVNPSKPTEAIAGAVMAGRCGSVVLYATSSTLPTTTRSRLSYYRYRIDAWSVAGTTSSISSAVRSSAKKALGG